jgi:hypothetical protein
MAKKAITMKTVMKTPPTLSSVDDVLLAMLSVLAGGVLEELLIPASMPVLSTA